ncbi:MAG: hypothetical protein IJV35_09340 [Neisseriaceae bacterium]|nr:hypothetical protein [Neisseriaceae bacterium]
MQKWFQLDKDLIYLNIRGIATPCYARLAMTGFIFSGSLKDCCILLLSAKTFLSTY